MSKSNNSMSAAADAETASSSNREQIIKGLNEDLAREYKAIIQYVVFSSTLKGAEYRDIAEQLKKHASQELAHAREYISDRSIIWVEIRQSKAKKLNIQKIQGRCLRLT